VTVGGLHPHPPLHDVWTALRFALRVEDVAVGVAAELLLDRPREIEGSVVVEVVDLLAPEVERHGISVIFTPFSWSVRSASDAPAQRPDVQIHRARGTCSAKSRSAPDLHRVGLIRHP
jgi:hypothetical protein